VDTSVHLHTQRAAHRLVREREHNAKHHRVRQRDRRARATRRQGQENTRCQNEEQDGSI
jgi:hypothetical protein